MLRSQSQVLYSYLPGAVFRHEDRIYGRVSTVYGDRLTDLNQDVVFEEIAAYLEQWPDEHRHELPLPRDMRIRDYIINKAQQVNFEIFPLVFECVRRSCGRVRSFTSIDQASRSPYCLTCRSPLQQLRFYNAHNCGNVSQIRVPRCTTHGYDHIVFEDTGSFLSATWKCRGEGCNNAFVSRTNLQPCNCTWIDTTGVARMRGHTLDDNRAYRAHAIDLVNIDSTAFQSYQKHQARGQIAVAHYLGLLSHLGEGLQQADHGSNSTPRLSKADWDLKEAKLRSMGMLNEVEIAGLRSISGPADTGLAGLGELPAGVLEIVAARRPFYERAAVFDNAEVTRETLAAQAASAEARGDKLAYENLSAAVSLTEAVGISELAVTWEFPIAKVAFGYTREKHEPGQSAIRGFRVQKAGDGKYPVYAVASKTEALLVTLSALEVLSFLHSRGEVLTLPADEDAAKRDLLSIFASEDSHPVPAATVRILVHTMSHLLLRGLDDGQIGFAEASLAEWLVPETLTFAIYANSLKEFTLGSLWTLLTGRASSWLCDLMNRSMRCENDPPMLSTISPILRAMLLPHFRLPSTQRESRS